MADTIQPHFINNALTAAVYEADGNEHLQETLMHIARFINGGVCAVAEEKSIPFFKEYEFFEHYLYIEKLRVGEKIKIYESICACNFSLPPQTLQIMVSAAIRYGFLKRNMKGKIYISVTEEENCFIIEIRDNGEKWGFEDVEKDINKADLNIIKERLKNGNKGNIYKTYIDGFNILRTEITKEQ